MCTSIDLLEIDPQGSFSCMRLIDFASYLDEARTLRQTEAYAPSSIMN